MRASTPLVHGVAAGAATAVVTAILYAAFMGSSLLGGLIVSIAGGSFIGLGTYRLRTGRRDYPDWLMIFISVSALTLYGAALALLGGAPGDTWEWFAVVGSFAVPIIVLFRIYRRRRSEG